MDLLSPRAAHGRTGTARHTNLRSPEHKKNHQRRRRPLAQGWPEAGRTYPRGVFAFANAFANPQATSALPWVLLRRRASRHSALELASCHSALELVAGLDSEARGGETARSGCGFAFSVRLPAVRGR